MDNPAREFIYHLRVALAAAEPKATLESLLLKLTGDPSNHLWSRVPALPETTHVLDQLNAGRIGYLTGLVLVLVLMACSIAILSVSMRKTQLPFGQQLAVLVGVATVFSILLVWVVGGLLRARHFAMVVKAADTREAKLRAMFCISEPKFFAKYNHLIDDAVLYRNDAALQLRDLVCLLDPPSMSISWRTSCGIVLTLLVAAAALTAALTYEKVLEMNETIRVVVGVSFLLALSLMLTPRLIKLLKSVALADLSIPPLLDVYDRNIRQFADKMNRASSALRDPSHMKPGIANCLVVCGLGLLALLAVGALYWNDDEGALHAAAGVGLCGVAVVALAWCFLRFDQAVGEDVAL